MKRVLYVVTTLEIGGAEQSLLELIRRLDRTKIAPAVCTLISGGALRKRFAELDVPVVELGVAAGAAELYGLRIAPLLLRLRPHLVHSRLVLSNLWARLGRAVGAPVINEERGLADDRPSWMTTANRWTERLVAIHVANSRAVASRMRTRDGIAADRIRVIYGGVDTNRFTPRTTEPVTVDLISVTRLERYKGVFELVEAVALLARDRPGLRCMLVGEGSQRAPLEARIAALGLGDVITLAGHRADVTPLLRTAKIFVMPSHEEGLPNAVMEAMACGLAVVATAVGGNRELVVDEATGLLVAGRDPVALAAGLRRYIDEPRLAAAHGMAARARACERFSIERSAAEYVALYDELW